MEFQVGELLGTFRITEVMSDGTWAAVYAAVHTSLGRKVAIKVLKPEVSQDEEVIGRFFREARTIGEINHPHIVKITDVVEQLDWDPPIYYMVMEHLAGQDVHSHMRAKGPPGVEEVVSIGRQAADALSAVHAAKILHRDLKPENIFLIDDPDGGIFIKLMDFGVARAFGARQEPRLTAVGMAVGTPEFMAPEQLLDKELDERTDIYGLGVTLYDMLTGAPPFLVGSDYGEFVLRKTSEAAPPIGPRRAGREPIPPALEAVVMRCLERQPAARFQSALELRDALDASLGRPPRRLSPHASPIPPRDETPRAEAEPAREARLPTLVVRTHRPFPRWVLVSALAIGGLAVLGATLISHWQTSGPPQPAAKAPRGAQARPADAWPLPADGRPLPADARPLPADARLPARERDATAAAPDLARAVEGQAKAPRPKKLQPKKKQKKQSLPNEGGTLDPFR